MPLVVAAFLLLMDLLAEVVGDWFCFFEEMGLPGVARRQPTFFASSKKVGKERRPRYTALPVPAAAAPQSGNERNSLRSDNVRF